MKFLEKILVGNILSFAKGIKWTIESEVRLRIHELAAVRPITYKGAKVLTFDLLFYTNVLLPDYIGLGKAVSLGFGVVSRVGDR